MQHMSLAYYVTSPGGDRYDCFRHYEALSVHTVPITNLPSKLYKPLFCDSMIMDINHTAQIFNVVYNEPVGRYQQRVANSTNILQVDFWRQRVQLALHKKKGESIIGCQ